MSTNTSKKKCRKFFLLTLYSYNANSLFTLIGEPICLPNREPLGRTKQRRVPKRHFFADVCVGLCVLHIILILIIVVVALYWRSSHANIIQSLATSLVRICMQMHSRQQVCCCLYAVRFAIVISTHIHDKVSARI